MDADPEIIYSPLNREYESDIVQVEVCIFKIETSDWTLEVIDDFNNSTVWEKGFKTDQEAFSDFKKTIREDGIGSVSGPVVDNPFSES